VATFNVINLGCKVNRAESDTYEAALASMGLERTQTGAAADAQVVVVNTCTVTGEAEKKTRKTVRAALARHPKAEVIVTGCAAAISPEVFCAMSPRVTVLPKAQVDDYLQALREKFQALTEKPQVTHVNERCRIDVKIQDGCNNACTFCIVHTARGKSQSRPAPEVIEECVALARAGVPEIVLTGINLGAYSWQDMQLHDLLAQLLQATSQITPATSPFCTRFRISSIEPKNVTQELLELMAASNGRVCKHLHLPLQAGSSKVLREMARPYSAEFFEALVAKMRAIAPEISISTDIICGFPGETDAEFEETLELARRCAFSKIHVFPYSVRENTPAAARADQVPPQVKAARSARMRALSDELRAQDLLSRNGNIEFCVVEKPGCACTESYHEVQVDPAIAAGTLVKFKLLCCGSVSEPCARGCAC
jgi:threonylcarbamoyladenosine tRNA methylthiotransferase MtaB